MATTSSKAVLITGANVGLGKEVARQLALTDDFNRIYLACRNADSGQSAAFDLQRLTGRPIFSVVRMDLTDLDSVRSALNTLDGPLHSVVMNAGGTGGPTPLALTADGVTHVFGSNVLGHVVLLENLLAAGALTNTAVLVGSEAARGVRMMRMPRPTFTDHSVEEFASVIDGSYFEQHEFNTFLAYGQVKYLGPLWMSALARRHPDLRLLTASPGNTAGTDALRDMSTVTRAMMNHVMLPYVLLHWASATSWRRAQSGWPTASPTIGCAAACSTPADRAKSSGPSSTSRRSSPTSRTRQYNKTPTKPSIAS